MTTGGWVFMAASWSVITLVAAYCMINVLRPAKPAGEQGTPSEDRPYCAERAGK